MGAHGAREAGPAPSIGAAAGGGSLTRCGRSGRV